MSYLHIPNLYKEQDILLFKECFALEKIHGTSAHISYKASDGGSNCGKVNPSRLEFFAGGSNHNEFIKLFDAEALKQKLDSMLQGNPNSSCHVYGEAYGGKLMGMGKTYGDKLRFVAFEVKIGDTWLNVAKAAKFVADLGLEFVHYSQIPTTMEAIDAEILLDSVQAIRNGMGEGHMREGIVLRPIEEVTKNNGERVIAKHKRDEFRETATPHKVISEERLKVIADAKAIANEWVTFERLRHVLDKNQLEAKIENTGKLIACMSEDILRESAGEIVDSPDARKEMARSTALLFKDYLKSKLCPEDFNGDAGVRL